METITRSNTGSKSGASNATEGVLANASAGAHTAVDSIAGAADGAVRRAKPAIEQVATMAHQAVDKVAGAAEPAADWLAEQGDSLNETQKKLMKDACGYVSANPLKSVGIAVLAGFLLSRITR
jgi:ElaB/YqjD/DUF883 family membrane-anchored ribosome-binding protein